MTDETPQPQGDTAPAVAEAAVAEAPPAAAPVDVESIVSARLNDWEEKRIKPLQTMLNERDAEIKKLKTASMSEEDRAQLEIDERQNYVTELETRAWLAEKKATNPQAAELTQRILALEDPDELFNVLADLASRVAPASPAPAVEPEASDLVPDIDPNNPAPTRSPGLAGQIGDPKFREEYLKSFDSWPTNR